MAMNPVRVSKRVSIAWSGAPASEDTDTVVLTIHDHSLDLRVFTDGPRKGEIDWALVALVRTLPSQGDKPVLRWEHIIDSRGAPADGDGGDEGAFDVLPNGDVLETGTMFNPASGKEEAYEEMWRRFPVEAGASYCVLERVDAGWGKPGNRQAFLGRFGSRALGLAQDGAVFRAYRDELEGEGWKRVYAFDVGEVLPALDVVQDAGWKEGETVALGGGEWVVRSAGKV